jgi:hypothetical protein
MLEDVNGDVTNNLLLLNKTENPTTCSQSSGSHVQSNLTDCLSSSCPSLPLKNPSIDYSAGNHLKYAQQSETIQL